MFAFFACNLNPSSCFQLPVIKTFPQYFIQKSQFSIFVSY